MRSFRAARMRKARSCIAVLDRQPEPRLDAGCRPFPPSVSRRFAKLHATAVRARFRTMAVARADCDSPQLWRCVARYNEGATEKTRQQGSCAYPKIPAERLVGGWLVHRAILRVMAQKTDSARRPKILLPGSWNWPEGGVGCEKRTDSRFRCPAARIGTGGQTWLYNVETLSQPTICQ